MEILVDLDFVYYERHNTCDPRHSRMCSKGQLFKSVTDGLSVTLPKRVYAKCHGKISTSMMGLMWASIVVLIEQGVIMEGELIQIASEKHFFSI